MSEIYSVAPPVKYGYIATYSLFIPYRPKQGQGYFSSSFPDYLISVEGRPASGVIRVLLRTPRVPEADGCLVATTTADVAGQWRIDGLDADMRYDVVCRVEGYNDIIFSNVKPKV